MPLGVPSATPEPTDGKVYTDGLDAERPFDGFIVKYREQSPAAAGDLRAAQEALPANSRVPLSAVVPLSLRRVLVRGAGPLGRADAVRAMREIARHQDVELVEPNFRVPPPSPWDVAARQFPNDPLYPWQWHYHEVSLEPAALNLPPAWADGLLGRDVTVAVVDTGRTRHPDLDAKMVSGYDFVSDPKMARDGDGRDPDPSDEGDWHAPRECSPDDPGAPSSWHGTHVAGTVGAVTNDGFGVAGVAPEARIQHLRVLGLCGGTDADVADAIVWAAGGKVPDVPRNPDPADVINLSLGGNGACPPMMNEALRFAAQRDMVSVVAAGNSNTPITNSSPANCPARKIVVAALNRVGDKASYSNFGARGQGVDVAAPGGETAEDPRNGVLSTLNTGETTPKAPAWAYYQGTSMATPHVAGLAALLLERWPGFLVKDIIEDSVRPIPGSCGPAFLRQCGVGLADAGRAAEWPALPSSPEPQP
ncbi:hypothetical protein GCM10012275_47240 [Longimycelium tulufanense]|uniref:Peptidase S8/S53 domain-containing protein n=1 Tax=Longimycelium tulufanense TaxID=907463 RepID=A0A8J3FVT2_9PSEU|nr:hypothetical protein GCM10012275_47240 [Longimycelium tulufanense]